MLIKFLIIIISLILIGILANYSGKLVELIKLSTPYRNGFIRNVYRSTI